MAKRSRAAKLLAAEPKAKGIDISTWQGKPNWVIVGQEAGLSFCFTKITEGAGWIEDWQDNWSAQKSIGLLRSPYHFHKANVNGILQADFFMQQAPKDGELPVMIDFEDAASLMLTEITGEQVLENLRACLLRLETKWGLKRIIVYTGMWFLQACLAESPNYDATWLKKYILFIANYTQDPDIPPYKPDWWPWTFYQWSSLHIVPGFTVRVDEDVFNGTEEELFTFAGIVEEQKMLYKSDVEPKNRGKFMLITSADARTAPGADPSTADLDVQIIRAGGSDGIHPTQGTPYRLYQDVAWDTRQKYAEEKKIRVALLFEHDPGWYGFNDVDEVMVHTRPVQDDPVCMQILRTWNKNPAATWEQIRTSRPEDWRPVQALILSQFATARNGKEIGDLWFTLSISNVLEKIKALMDGGIVPVLPIVLLLDPDTVKRYQVNLLTWFTYPGRNQWLYLGYKKLLLLKGHDTIATLAECWPWAVLNFTAATQFSYVPDGYDKRIVVFIVTEDRMFVPLYTDSAGNPRPVTLALYNDTSAALRAWLPLGTPPNPGDPLEPRVAALEAEVSELNERVYELEQTGTPAAVLQRLVELEAWRAEIGNIVIPK